MVIRVQSLRGFDDSSNRKPDGHLMLDSVRSILLSGQSDDAISGELAELVGFDELELVSSILSDRDQFFGEPRVANELAINPLPQKKESGNLCRLRRSDLFTCLPRPSESCTRPSQKAYGRTVESECI